MDHQMIIWVLQGSWECFFTFAPAVALAVIAWRVAK